MLPSLLDEKAAYSAKDVAEKKYVVFYIRDVGVAPKREKEVIDWAKSNDVALIDRNLDFEKIINFPLAEFLGVVVLRIPSFYSAEQTKKALDDFTSKVDIKNIPKALIIIDEGKESNKK